MKQVLFQTPTVLSRMSNFPDVIRMIADEYIFILDYVITLPSKYGVIQNNLLSLFVLQIMV